ncbi:MAG: hypothetical protein QNK89_01160 [Lacinutrix sp.]|uniref:hypothetical protein n=1 Tax=Lacinutrix sp. TaxID=1937692 RepID=UPI0030B440AC
MKIYKKGPIGALASEYENALIELKAYLVTIPNNTFTNVENDSAPKEFQSARNIVLHVVNSGYIYVNHIRKRLGKETILYTFDIQTTKEAIVELDKMFEYTLSAFEDLWEFTYSDLMHTIIKTSWTTYDLEALIEHAIVHVLRHHRQIERTIN